MKRRTAVCVIGLVLSASVTTQAASITWAGDVPSPAIAAGRPLPDIFPGDAFTVGIVFDSQELTFVASHSADIEFTADPSDVTIEHVVDQSFINDSGQTWIGMQMELGFGTGAGFTRSSPSDGLEFALADLGSYFSSSHWTSL